MMLELDRGVEDVSFLHVFQLCMCWFYAHNASYDYFVWYRGKVYLLIHYVDFPVEMVPEPIHMSVSSGLHNLKKSWSLSYLIWDLIGKILICVSFLKKKKKKAKAHRIKTIWLALHFYQSKLKCWTAPTHRFRAQPKSWGILEAFLESVFSVSGLWEKPHPYHKEYFSLDVHYESWLFREMLNFQTRPQAHSSRIRGQTAFPKSSQGQNWWHLEGDRGLPCWA